MKCCFYVHQITPHLMPLAREMVKRYGADEFRYIYNNPLEESRKNLGWDGVGESWVLRKGDSPIEAEEWLEHAEILFCEYRDLELWEKRVKSGKGMYYTSERWYKPINLFRLGCRDVALPGFLRLLHPSFFKMARKAVELFNSGRIINLVDGPHCAKDFLRTVGLISGDLRCIFKAPAIEFENKPFGEIRLNGVICKNIKMWGYFVAPATSPVQKSNNATPMKVLWVGRFLKWKRVDTLIKAVKGLDVALDLYGAGPEEHNLRKLAADTPNIEFHPPVPVSDVRKLMREHDVYVLPSNEYEGWGAVVNEALEEGMRVLGSYEAGASAAILPEENLFHCWDARCLRGVISKGGGRNKIGMWSVSSAAEFIRKGA